MKTKDRADKSEEFATAGTFGLIVKYSIPTIVGMLANALYVLVDRVFVGHLPGSEGTLGIAGITVAMPATIIIFAFAMLAGAGAGANISLNMGRGDHETAERTMGNGALMGVAAALILSVVFLIFIDPILLRFGASPETLPHARSYLTVILIGATVNTFGFCLSRFILAQGFTTVSMAAMIVGVLVNVTLSPLFMFVFRMGLKGAALATVIAQFASAGFSLYHIRSGRMPLRLHLINFKPDGALLLRIAAIGVSPFALQLASSIVQTILNGALKTYGGDVAIATMGSVASLAQVMLMPIYGINQGTQPLIGFNYGAALYRRVRRLLLQAIGIAVCLMTAFWLVLMLGAERMILLFGAGNTGMIALGPVAIRQFLMLLPLAAFQIVGSNYFQAVGKPAHALVLVLLRQVLILIPAVLVLPLLLGLNGVFLAGPVSDLLSSLVTGVFLLVELKRLKRQA